MGLDMYINHTNRTNHSIEQLLSIDGIEGLNPKSPEAEALLPLREYEYLKNVFSIFHQGAYWRKANAVHGWFVEKVQKGTDDCGYYELTREHLEELKKDCEAAIETKNTKALQPQSGFFFGSTAIDEGYWADLKSTVTQINKILKMNWDTRRFFYHSSW